jgi:hypothetical protein
MVLLSRYLKALTMTHVKLDRLWGVRQTQLHEENNLKLNCKPITKITINIYSKNQMRPTNNSTDKTSHYVTLKHVYLFITALVKTNFVPFENELIMNTVYTL